MSYKLKTVETIKKRELSFISLTPGFIRVDNCHIINILCNRFPEGITFVKRFSHFLLTQRVNYHSLQIKTGDDASGVIPCL